MTKYRLVASGKLYHLIKLMSDRTECLPTSKKEPIADHYELEEVQPETMQTMGHKTGDNEAATKATIKMKFKMVIQNNNVNLLSMSISEWKDPGNKLLGPTWKEMNIRLATVTDSNAKIPKRYCGETTLELNTSYIQMGQPSHGRVIRWYKHVSKLPAWASETEYLNEARWIEEKVFGSITSNVIQKSKEVRLEEKRNEGEKIERPIFPDDEKNPYIYYGKLDEQTKEIIIEKFNLVEQKTGRLPTYDKSLEEPARLLNQANSANESRQVGVDVTKTESYDHLDNKNNSVKMNESETDEGNKIVQQYKEMNESMPMYHRDESNQDIQHINEMAERVHITNRESSNQFAQHRQEMAEDLPMSHRDEDSRIIQYNRNMSESVRMKTKNKNERPIRQVINYVQLTHNSSAGTKVSNKGRNMGNNKNREEQREHTEFVRIYNNQQKNLLMNKGIQCEIPPTEEVRQTGLPNQTPIGDLIMFTPRINAPREPLMQQPRIRFQTDLLVTETPIRMGVKDPQLLPRNPPHPLLETNIRLEEVQKRLEENKKINNGRRVNVKKTSTKEKEKEPEEAHYEEIPEKEGENDDDQATPKSWLPNTFPLRQRTPPKVIVNCSPDSLPRAFITKTRARPPFHFQEPQTPPPNIPQEATQWQEEYQQLGATGGEGWERQVHHEEHLNEE